jgi:hypothetical protein
MHVVTFSTALVRVAVDLLGFDADGGAGEFVRGPAIMSHLSYQLVCA